ncbi:hypothetical protein SDC9_74380 [bioreactor metagenome]|uniref:Uncharacterized protein n=1 Tax=bioreactor metagenome TaxID=1076179 RepID=A0A644YH12_9ZZZZ
MLSARCVAPANLIQIADQGQEYGGPAVHGVVQRVRVLRFVLKIYLEDIGLLTGEQFQLIGPKIRNVQGTQQLSVRHHVAHVGILQGIELQGAAARRAFCALHGGHQPELHRRVVGQGNIIDCA